MTKSKRNLKKSERRRILENRNRAKSSFIRQRTITHLFLEMLLHESEKVKISIILINE